MNKNYMDRVYYGGKGESIQVTGPTPVYDHFVPEIMRLEYFKDSHIEPPYYNPKDRLARALNLIKRDDELEKKYDSALAAVKALENNNSPSLKSPLTLNAFVWNPCSGEGDIIERVNDLAKRYGAAMLNRGSHCISVSSKEAKGAPPCLNPIPKLARLKNAERICRAAERAKNNVAKYVKLKPKTIDAMIEAEQLLAESMATLASIHNQLISVLDTIVT